ncbi:MAG: CC/Se motif family (seleno)protein [Thermoanaerobacteraceae bacterium]|nr:CC/Se motif family (seleno)protein [Thermoanaerobacteraceae bacterium]
MPIPSVMMGKPKDADRFDSYTVDGFEVYVAKSIDVKEDGLKLYIEGFGLLSRLGVEGIKLF